MFLGMLDRKSAQDHDFESLKAFKLNWSESFPFLMYYIYGSIQAIPTYRLYDRSCRMIYSKQSWNRVWSQASINWSNHAQECAQYAITSPSALPRDLQFGQLDKPRADVMIDEHESARSYQAYRTQTYQRKSL